MSEENPCFYQQFSPNAALAPYVECFWILEAPSHLSTGSERLPADGRVEVMFHLAGPSKRYRTDGQGEPHVQRTSSILGGRSRGYVVEQIGASHYVAIRFRPGGIAPFIDIPLTDLMDQVVNLDVTWGQPSRYWKSSCLMRILFRILSRYLTPRFWDGLSAFLTFGRSRLQLPVANQQIAKAFYTEILGFTVIRDNPFEQEYRWIELAPNGSAPMITLVTWFPHMPPGSIHGLVLVTDNLAEAHETLKRRGLDISPIETVPWGQFATFTDPDGNGWVLQQTTPDA